MTKDLVIAILICVGLVGVTAAWLMVRRYRQRLETLEEQSRNLRIELEEANKTLQSEAHELRARMQSLIENPVPPTDRQLADYLTGVFQRAEKHVATMSAARANSSPSLVFASEEAGKAAVRERRERFCGYRDALRDANIQLSSYSERLVAVAPSIVSLVGALENGHFNPEIGKAECDSIEKIGAALLHEESPDDVWKRRIRATMREFELMSSARQRLRHLEREEREAHDLSFQKSGLPPLTPWQKFLQLKPTGQRDGFG